LKGVTLELLEPQLSPQSARQIINPIRAIAALFLAKRPFELAQRKQCRSQIQGNLVKQICFSNLKTEKARLIED